MADFAEFTRRAHLRNVILPGGDAAVRRPWRMALSYLRDTFGTQMPSGLDCFRDVSEKQLELVDAMIARRVQTVETSSCGRLFDAVAALVGLGPVTTFEGQAAIALESAVAQEVERRYDFEIEGETPAVLDFRPMIASIVKDLSTGEAVGEISSRFHNTICAAIVEVCCRIRDTDGLNRVCLSGGTFQNLYLQHRTAAELRLHKFGVFLHATVPSNDGGISLGQAVIANERLQRGE